MNYRPRHICVLSTFQRIAKSIEMNFITGSNLQPIATTIDRLSIVIYIEKISAPFKDSKPESQVSC